MDNISVFNFDSGFYDTYKIQMQLLGYLNFYEEKNDNDEKKIKYVVLTPKGKDKLIKLRAITK